MDIKIAEEILDERGRTKVSDAPDFEKNRTLKGLQILAKYDDNIKCLFFEKYMIASRFSATVVKMSEEEVRKMAMLNWWSNDNSDRWAHF